MNTYLVNPERSLPTVNQPMVKAAVLPKSENNSASAWLLKISLFLIVAGLTAITLLLNSCISGVA